MRSSGPSTLTRLGSSLPIPRPGVAAQDLRSIPGRVPSPVDFPTGCRFGPRCPHAELACTEPQELQPAGLDRLVRCHRHHELELPGAAAITPH